MRTYVPKRNEIKKEWFLIDAANMPLGRLASCVAKILTGKNKAIYMPNMDTGDFVVVVNCKKIKLTGDKIIGKYYIHHTGYIGHLKKERYKELMITKPEWVLFKAVKGMLPKNKLGRQILSKLKVYASETHKHEAQKPKLIKV